MQNALYLQVVECWIITGMSQRLWFIKVWCAPLLAKAKLQYPRSQNSDKAKWNQEIQWHILSCALRQHLRPIKCSWFALSCLLMLPFIFRAFQHFHCCSCLCILQVNAKKKHKFRSSAPLRLEWINSAPSGGQAGGSPTYICISCNSFLFLYSHKACCALVYWSSNKRNTTYSSPLYFIAADEVCWKYSFLYIFISTHISITLVDLQTEKEEHCSVSLSNAL